MFVNRTLDLPSHGRDNLGGSSYLEVKPKQIEVNTYKFLQKLAEAMV